MDVLPKSRQTEIVVQELENETLIYDLTINKAFCLNQTAGLVFNLCDGHRTATQISEILSLKLKTSVNEDLVWLTINDLRKYKLIENSVQFPPTLTSQPRREMI